MTRAGKSCTYGITLLKNVKNREAAVAFLKFLMSPDGGLKILKEMGQPPFIPCRVASDKAKSQLPASLRNLVEVKN